MTDDEIRKTIAEIFGILPSQVAIESTTLTWLQTTAKVIPEAIELDRTLRGRHAAKVRNLKNPQRDPELEAAVVKQHRSAPHKSAAEIADDINYEGDVRTIQRILQKYRDTCR